MPIFHEPDDTRSQSPPLHSLQPQQPSPHLPHSWKPGNVFSFEGPPLDGTRAGPAIPSITNPEPAQASSPARATNPTLRDRVGLIERLKRAKSPPSQRVSGTVTLSVTHRVAQRYILLASANLTTEQSPRSEPRISSSLTRIAPDSATFAFILQVPTSKHPRSTARSCIRRSRNSPTTFGSAFWGF